MRHFFLFLLIGLSTCLSAQEENLFNFKNSKAFANYLLKNGNYADAANEYERVLFMRPQNDTIKLNLIRAYRKSGQLDNAYNRFLDFHPNPVDRSVPLAYSHEFFSLLLLAQDYKGAYMFSNRSPQFNPVQKSNKRLGSLLLLQDWERAQKEVDKGYATDKRLLALNDQAQTLDYKSATLAAGLSTLVPGLGKVYTGRNADGILAFIFVGANAFAAYRGFSQNGISSGYGWLFSALGGAYYVSNIYGSYRSAKYYNSRKDDAIQNETRTYLLGTL